MSIAALIAFLNANQGLIATILFLFSETLGALPKVKSNGVLSFALIQAQKYLKDKGAKDVTP